ncbi:MAG TPA: DUF2269 family protein [Ktedonobacterales bacterium]
MSWYLILKLVHVLCAVAFLAGLIGRGMVRLRIPHITSIQTLQEIMVLVARFDELLVIRGAQLTLVSGLLVWWAGGWPLAAGGHPTWVLVSTVLFLSQLPLVFLVFIPRGKAFAKIFGEALAQQRITSELRAALADRAVRYATVYETVTVAIILPLMVLKSF